MAKLFEKNICKIIITKDVLSNIQIFSSYFIIKIKNQNIDKVYKKNWLVI